MSPVRLCRRTRHSSRSRCGPRSKTRCPVRVISPTTPAGTRVLPQRYCPLPSADGSVTGRAAPGTVTCRRAWALPDSSATSSPGASQQTSRQVPHGTRVEGSRGRLHRGSRHEHRHIRVPEQHRRRPRAQRRDAAAESFDHAEERRLFYVALTRARRAVVLITSQQRMSPFVGELLDDLHVKVTGERNTPVEICSRCRKGVMVKRVGRSGAFLGCSTFPACTHTRNLPQSPPGQRSSYSRRS